MAHGACGAWCDESRTARHHPACALQRIADHNAHRSSRGDRSHGAAWPRAAMRNVCTCTHVCTYILVDLDMDVDMDMDKDKDKGMG